MLMPRSDGSSARTAHFSSPNIRSTPVRCRSNSTCRSKSLGLRTGVAPMVLGVHIRTDKLHVAGDLLDLLEIVVAFENDGRGLMLVERAIQQVEHRVRHLIAVGVHPHGSIEIGAGHDRPAGNVNTGHNTGWQLIKERVRIESMIDGIDV